MRTVYVPYDDGKNLEPAKEFGEICILLSPKDIKQGYDHIVDLLDNRLNNISSEDYLVLIGDPIVIAITAHIALELTNGTVNMLKWDRIKYKYEPVEVNV